MVIIIYMPVRQQHNTQRKASGAGDLSVINEKSSRLHHNAAGRTVVFC
jgi:hypothetical protein